MKSKCTKNLKRFKKIAMNCNVWKNYDLKQKILQKLYQKVNDLGQNVGKEKNKWLKKEINNLTFKFCT